MSTHIIPVIQIDNVNPHNNADSLEIIKVFDYQVVVRKGQFKIGDLAVYIEPDYMVPVIEPEFTFLADKAKNGYARISAIRLRSERSFGLLISARDGWKVGDNVLDILNIKRYEPEITGIVMQTEDAPAPNVFHVKYDMENYRRYSNTFEDYEFVEISEKINGSNSKFVFTNGCLNVGSHTRWKKRNDQNVWWKAAIHYDLETKLQKYPDYVFYGELYGHIKGYRYGCENGNFKLAFFDIMKDGKWLNVGEVNTILNDLNLPKVPIFYNGPWSNDLIRFADGLSTIEGSNHIREGVVVKPFINRYTPEVGRVILKIVSFDYLSAKHKK
jgi:RNA ligase (TIGR02306 family)